MTRYEFSEKFSGFGDCEITSRDIAGFVVYQETGTYKETEFNKSINVIVEYHIPLTVYKLYSDNISNVNFVVYLSVVNEVDEDGTFLRNIFKFF